jgi:hypothetical protein
MSKLNQSPRVNVEDPQLRLLIRDHATQINMLAEGRLGAVYNASIAPPTTGSNAQGDQLRNSAPIEEGAALSKYVVTGWICVNSGTPGTWLPLRNLTGN